MRRIYYPIFFIINIILIFCLIFLYWKINKNIETISKLEGQIAYIIERLPSSPSPENRGSEKETENTIKSLINELKTNNLITQYQAGLKLKRIGSPAIPHLVEALKTSKGKTSRPLLLLIQEIGDKDLAPELMDIYKASDDQINKAGILTILGEWNVQESKALLIEATKDADWRVKAASAQALTNYSDEGTLTLLINLLADRHRYVRTAAQRAIKSIGEKDKGIESLKHLLEKGDNKTRYLLVKHLPKVGGKNAKELLKIAAQDKNMTIRNMAEKQLSE